MSDVSSATEPGRPEAERDPDVRSVIGNPQVFALWMAAIDERVAARTRERNESLRNWLIGSLTVVVIALTAVAGFAFDYLAQRAVGTAVEQALSAYEVDFAIANLNVRALRLQIGERFSDEEAESFISETASL